MEIAHTSSNTFVILRLVPFTIDSQIYSPQSLTVISNIEHCDLGSSLHMGNLNFAIYQYVFS